MDGLQGLIFSPRLAFGVRSGCLCRGRAVRGLWAILGGLVAFGSGFSLSARLSFGSLALIFRLCWLFGFSVGLVLGSDA